eukprot:m.127810 g.127810  ORF g.127810 m.127810 type:complete len:785 (-) comp19874_c0_seq1:86-2440(-)
MNKEEDFYSSDSEGDGEDDRDLSPAGNETLDLYSDSDEEEEQKLRRKSSSFLEAMISPGVTFSSKTDIKNPLFQESGSLPASPVKGAGSRGSSEAPSERARTSETESISNMFEWPDTPRISIDDDGKDGTTATAAAAAIAAVSATTAADSAQTRPSLSCNSTPTTQRKSVHFDQPSPAKPAPKGASLTAEDAPRVSSMSSASSLPPDDARPRSKTLSGPSPSAKAAAAAVAAEAARRSTGGMLGSDLAASRKKMETFSKSMNDLSDAKEKRSMSLSFKRLFGSRERLPQSPVPARRDEAHVGTFRAKYYGSRPVPQDQAGRCKPGELQAAISEIKRDHAQRKKSKEKSVRVFLVVSAVGIELVPMEENKAAKNSRKEALQIPKFVPLDAIAGCHIQPGKQSRFVSFITADAKENITYCHVIKTEDMGDPVVKAMASSVGVAENMKRDPFAQTWTTPLTPEAINPPRKQHEVKRAALAMVKEIGSGQFGKVYLATLKTDKGESVKAAVKLMRLGAGSATEQQFLRELDILIDLRHENLSQLLGVCLDRKPWLIVLSLMEHGDFLKVIRLCQQTGVMLWAKEWLEFSVQIAKAMQYMAKMRYVHRDLALRNVLLNRGNRVCVADFGLTVKLNHGQDYYKMTAGEKLPARIMAVECFVDKMFSEASDVWAFGCLCWELLTYGGVPYREVQLPQLRAKVCTEGLRPADPEFKYPECPPDANEEGRAVFSVLLDLMKVCWVAEKRQRPTFSGIVAQLEGELQSLKHRQEDRDLGFTVVKMIKEKSKAAK